MLCLSIETSRPYGMIELELGTNVLWYVWAIDRDE